MSVRHPHKSIATLAATISLLASCASVPPIELIQARKTFNEVSRGPAARLAPAELHIASTALAEAERSYNYDASSYQTRDLAYVATRRAQLADAIGSIAQSKANTAGANAAFLKRQAAIVKQGTMDLQAAEQKTAAAMAELQLEKAAQRTSEAEFRRKQVEIASQGQLALRESEQRTAKALADLQASEQRTTDALAQLRTLAATKEESRGLVITLSGAILFHSDESKLLASAQTKLDEVAKSLLAVTPTRYLLVEGHTDSQGSEDHNLDLSNRRANAVRNYLVQQQYRADHITAKGLGKSRPIATNDTATGRANNRRVEIVVQHTTQSAQTESSQTE